MFKRNRIKLNKELKDIEKRKFFSPAIYSSYQKILPAIQKYVRGDTIDLGCGEMLYKKYLIKKAAVYDTFDIEERTSGITYIGNIQDMKMIRDSSYDSAICLQVLEHVRDPFKAVSEISRILKPQGIIILSVPHISRLHEEPNDFYRFTKYGLKYLLERHNFRVLELQASGGLFSFLGHQWSMLFVLAFWRIPIVKHLLFFINIWLCLKPCLFLDKIFDKRKLFALDYICVAKKVSDNHLY